MNRKPDTTSTFHLRLRQEPESRSAAVSSVHTSADRYYTSALTHFMDATNRDTAREKHRSCRRHFENVQLMNEGLEGLSDFMGGRFQPLLCCYSVLRGEETLEYEGYG